MLSFIFCSRVKDNPDSNLPRLLDSALEYISPEEREHVELLIKFDDDDDRRPDDGFFKSYPFAVRTFCWSRGEGRHSLHHAQEYLFAQRDLRSRFCWMTADDFYFTRPGFVTEILNRKEEFLILGPGRPPVERFAGNYEDDEAVRKWVISFGPGLAPIVSARLIEVCQNFGWQANVDSWLMILSIALYDLYKIIIWDAVKPFYDRGGGYGLGDTPTYNNMEVTYMRTPRNRYWFELVRRQARNVFLNMEHGTDLSDAGPPHRRLWRKIRQQPLHHLPLRVCRKILKEIKTVLS